VVVLKVRTYLSLPRCHSSRGVLVNSDLFYLGDEVCSYDQSITLNQTKSLSIISGQSLLLYFNVTSVAQSSYFLITLQTTITNNISVYISFNSCPYSDNYDLAFSSNYKLKTQYTLSSNFTGLSIYNPDLITTVYLTINYGNLQ
jgi:hypothetical protein